MDELKMSDPSPEPTGRDVLNLCPVCGGAVTDRHPHVRAWPGTWAHQWCASYVRRAHRRVHQARPA